VRKYLHVAQPEIGINISLLDESVFAKPITAFMDD
jgi:hypothetical protein